MEQLSEQQIEEFKKAFQHFDMNGDGVISIDELSVAMRELGHYPTEIELQEMIQEADANRDNVLDFEEFVAMMLRTIHDSETEMKTLEAFKLFDPDGTGYILKAELKTLMLNFGEPMKEEEIDELLGLAEDEQGQIEYEQFIKSIFTV